MESFAHAVTIFYNKGFHGITAYNNLIAPQFVVVLDNGDDLTDVGMKLTYAIGRSSKDTLSNCNAWAIEVNECKFGCHCERLSRTLAFHFGDQNPEHFDEIQAYTNPRFSE